MKVGLTREELNRLILGKYPAPDGQYCEKIVWYWSTHVDGVEIVYNKKPKT